jgi:hypothetical protein
LSPCKPEPAPSWKVSIRHHPVAPRWIIPACSTTVPAVDRDHAISIAIGERQRAAGVPPIKSLRAISRPFCSATRLENPSAVAPFTRAVDDQLVLPFWGQVAA